MKPVNTATAAQRSLHVDASEISENAQDDAVLVKRRRKSKAKAPKEQASARRTNEQMKGVFEQSTEEATDLDSGVERANSGRARKGDTLDEMEISPDLLSDAKGSISASSSGGASRDQSERPSEVRRVDSAQDVDASKSVEKSQASSGNTLLRKSVTLNQASTSSLALTSSFEGLSAKFKSHAMWQSDPLFFASAMRAQSLIKNGA